MLASLTRFRRMVRGACDYRWRPEFRDPWGGPFNDQAARVALFRSLLEAFHPWAIVETGAFRGTTTEFFARTGLPVFSAEADAYAFGFSWMRMRPYRNATVLHGDSRAVLRKCLAGPAWLAHGSNPFFYLDAHWRDDLPLAEEIDIVFGRCPDAIVMIDDYAVPGDAGYAYDDYGPGKALDMAYIAPAVHAHKLAAFHPSTPSARETGARRGCIVLVGAARHETTLASLPLLRRA